MLYCLGAFPFVRYRRLNLGPPTIRDRLKVLRDACVTYYQDWGVLPWDEHGEGAALYKLKGYQFDDSVEPAPWFDAPVDPQRDVTGPAHFDDATERLLGCDFEYLNVPSPAWDKSVVLFAEQWWVRDPQRGWRWFITVDGYLGKFPVSRRGNKTRLVGWRLNPDTGALIPPNASSFSCLRGEH